MSKLAVKIALEGDKTIREYIACLRAENEELRKQVVKCDECGDFEAAMIDWKARAESAEAKLKVAEKRIEALVRIYNEDTGSSCTVDDIIKIGGDELPPTRDKPRSDKD